MRFILIGRMAHPLPPEAAVPLMEGFAAWVNKYQGNGKLEQGWGFAGQMAGAMILNVDSHEELEEIMNEWPIAPIAPFAQYDLHATVDLGTAIERAAKVARAQVAQMAGTR